MATTSSMPTVRRYYYFARYYFYQFILCIYKLTILGVIFHELAHAAVILLRGYHVEEVNLLSHVQHEMPGSFTDAVLFAYAPLFVNTGIATIITYVLFGRSIPVVMEVENMGAVHLAAGFIVVSLLMHAVPSLDDIENIKTLFEMKFHWYRIDLIFMFIPTAIIFVPSYIGLKITRKTHTRFIVDFFFLFFAVSCLFGVIPIFDYITYIGVELWEILRPYVWRFFGFESQPT